jgi:hypothetical protein
MNVMKVISDVKDVEPKTESIIKRIKEMVNVLKLHGYLTPDKNQEEPLQAIDNTQALFNETTQRVFKIKADILPLQTQEAANIKKELVKFVPRAADQSDLPDRQFFLNVVNTSDPNYLAALLKHAQDLRFGAKNPQDNPTTIEVNEQWAKELQASPFYSRKNIAGHLL